jgi:hypothetical protein
MVAVPQLMCFAVICSLVLSRKEGTTLEAGDSVFRFRASTKLIPAKAWSPMTAKIPNYDKSSAMSEKERFLHGEYTMSGGLFYSETAGQ